MTRTEPYRTVRIDQVSFDARTNRYMAHATLVGGGGVHMLHVSTPGHAQWDHQQIISALKAKAKG